MKVDISVGEIVDKITILEIKNQRIRDERKLENINYELNALRTTWEESEYVIKDISEEFNALKNVNEQLWEIEDKIREKESASSFDQEFIELARSVYIINDKRAEIKKMINIKVGSDFTEEKSYSDYQNN